MPFKGFVTTLRPPRPGGDCVGQKELLINGSSGFLVGGTGHERASKRPHLRTVDRWNADWGALALMVERWLVPLIPFPSYKLCASDRPGAVKGARFARRSEPLTARTDLESYEGEGKGILQPSSHLPTKNPKEPFVLDGVCPYVGPAIVLESSWDLQGALQMLYRDRTLRATVTARNLALNTHGLTSSIYGLETHYPYGERLLIYDLARKKSHLLRDIEGACSYFQKAIRESGSACPVGSPGYGVPVLATERPEAGSASETPGYSLMRKSEGSVEEVIVSASGETIRISPGSMDGWVDAIRQQIGCVRLDGWASDGAHARPAHHVVAFVNGAANHGPQTVVPSSDVARRFETPLLAKAGFRVTLPDALIAQDPAPVVRVFAISRAGVASELKYQPVIQRRLPGSQVGSHSRSDSLKGWRVCSSKLGGPARHRPAYFADPVASNWACAGCIPILVRGNPC